MDDPRETSQVPALDRAVSTTFMIENPGDVALLLEFVAGALRAGHPVTLTAVCEPLEKPRPATEEETVA